MKETNVISYRDADFYRRVRNKCTNTASSNFSLEATPIAVSKPREIDMHLPLFFFVDEFSGGEPFASQAHCGGDNEEANVWVVVQQRLLHQ